MDNEGVLAICARFTNHPSMPEFEKREIRELIDRFGELAADRDHWRARAEALETALRKHGTCASCVYHQRDAYNGDEPCNSCLGKALKWQFDEVRFVEEGA